VEPVVASEAKLRWARRGLIVLLLAAVFWVTAAPLRCYDIWWLIALGREILSTWSVPFTDRFSHTAPGQPVEDFQRLSQVVYYLVYLIGDLEGLVVFRAGLFSLCAAILVRSARRRGASTTLAVVVVAVAVYGMLVRAHTRPQVLHYVMLALFTARLTDRLRGARVFWSLLPIEIAWANLHAGQAPLGIMLTGALVLHELLHAPPRERARVLARGAALILLLTACLALTPLGFDFFRVLVDGAGYDVTNFQNNDWLPLSWELFGHAQAGSYYVLPVMALLGLAGVAWRWRGRPLFDLLALLGFLILTFRLRRATASFMVVAAPIAAQCLERWVGELRDGPAWRWGRVLAALGALGAMIGFAPLASIQTPRFSVAWRLYPRDAVRWITEHRPPRELFHPYHLGGYFIWTLHPDYPVFVDGRDHVYHSAGVAREYVRMYDSLGECERITAAYGIQTVIATNSGNRVGPGETTPVLTCMESGDWALVFHGPVVTIYVRRTPENAVFIERHEYRLVRPQRRLDYIDRIPARHRAAFYAEVTRALREAPGFSEGLLLKGRLLLLEGDGQGAHEAIWRAFELEPYRFDVYVALLEVAERTAAFKEHDQVLSSLRRLATDRDLSAIAARFEAARARSAGSLEGGEREPPPPPVLWR
jgi:hypothetical protein